MNAETVRVNLRYDRTDLKRLLRYAKAHDVELDGRYDIRKPPRLNIWTHTWLNPGCRAESSLMFSLAFDWMRRCAQRARQKLDRDRPKPAAAPLRPVNSVR